MQNRYTGDLGDFGTFGLLRVLSGVAVEDDLPRFSVGVVWYLVPDETNTNDGKYTGYLVPSYANHHHYRECDPELYDGLYEIISSGERTVMNIRRRIVLAPETVYYEEPLSFAHLPPVGPDIAERRLAHRRAWLTRAHRSVRHCDIVFVGPDNGLEVSSVPAHHVRSPKYAFYEELLPYIEREQTLVIYQHLGRSLPAEAQIAARIAQLRDILPARDIHVARFRRGTSRAFLILPAPRHVEVIQTRLQLLRREPWARHFA